jgi:hypothetical protein
MLSIVLSHSQKLEAGLFSTHALVSKRSIINHRVPTLPCLFKTPKPAFDYASKFLILKTRTTNESSNFSPITILQRRVIRQAH